MLNYYCLKKNCQIPSSPQVPEKIVIRKLYHSLKIYFVNKKENKNSIMGWNIKKKTPNTVTKHSREEKNLFLKCKHDNKKLKSIKEQTT